MRYGDETKDAREEGHRPDESVRRDRGALADEAQEPKPEIDDDAEDDGHLGPLGEELGAEEEEGEERHEEADRDALEERIVVARRR